MPDNRKIRGAWRQIARGLGMLDEASRMAHLATLNEKLFPFLPAYKDDEHPVTFAEILDQENAGLAGDDFKFQDCGADTAEIFETWDALYQFTVAIDEIASGLPARVLWDTVADSGSLPEIPGVLDDTITISEALAQGEIEVLPQRGSSGSFDPPPLANPPDLLDADTKLIATSPDYGFPIPEIACASHRVLKLNDVRIMGADVPASLGGGIPVAGKIVPDAKGAGNGYSAGDIPAGLLAYLFARDGSSIIPPRKVEKTFLLPGAGIPDNHFHGIIDTLPALRHYLDAGLECPIVVPKLGRGIRALLTMILEQYGIPEDRIWSQKRASQHQIEVAILPPRHGIGGDLPEFYQPLVDEVLHGTGNRRYPPRIYLRRGLGGRRALSNEPDIERAMERFGFRVLEIWSLPMREQIAHLANASVIAGPFGAGLTNLVFARKGTRVIEILNHKNFEKLGVPYKRISDACGLEHFSIVPDSLFKSTSLTPGTITISMRRLDVLLKRLAPPEGFRARYRVWKHDLAKARRCLGKAG